MRRSRLLALAVGMTLTALLFTLLPWAGPAATAAPELTGDVGTMAVELDSAVASSGPPPGLLCPAVAGAIACFDPYGDRWYVKDTAADSASAEARWNNYLSNELYRTGICRNSLGAGRWGVCNKNYYEQSTVHWRACVYDASANRLIRCS